MVDYVKFNTNKFYNKNLNIKSDCLMGLEFRVKYFRKLRKNLNQIFRNARPIERLCSQTWL